MAHKGLTRYDKHKLMTQLLRPIRLHNRKITGLFGPNNIRLIYQYSLCGAAETTARMRASCTHLKCNWNLLATEACHASKLELGSKLCSPCWVRRYRGAACQLTGMHVGQNSEILCDMGIGTDPSAQL